MTDKERIKCKYKFQDKEKFDGKTYCTCFCELCEDLPPCDDNCQIYEDFKQLTLKTQECESLKSQLDFEAQQKELDEYKQSLDEKNKFLQDLGISAGGEFKRIKFYIESLKNKHNEKVKGCEELKKKLNTSEEWRIKAENLNEKQDLENTRYRKALDEIEDITQNHIINDFSNWNMGKISDDIVADYVTANCKQILDIINKAKGAEDER